MLLQESRASKGSECAAAVFHRSADSSGTPAGEWCPASTLQTDGFGAGGSKSEGCGVRVRSVE